jgi:hypothetical protein
MFSRAQRKLTNTVATFSGAPLFRVGVKSLRMREHSPWGEGHRTTRLLENWYRQLAIMVFHNGIIFILQGARLAPYNLGHYSSTLRHLARLRVSVFQC